MPGSRTFFIACFVVAMGMVLLLGAGALQSSEMPQEAMMGLNIWRDNQCESCHTLFGWGGAYAPDLTHIYNQRGESYIREFMVNPNAFHPEQRMMPRLTISVGETSQLIAFLEWVGETEAAEAWPPNPIQVSGTGGIMPLPVSMDSEQVETDPVIALAMRLFSQSCASCHSLEPDVIIVGPSLYGIADTAAERIPGVSAEEYIRESIVKPGVYIVEGFPDAMQKNFSDQLTSDELGALITLLLTLSNDT